MLQKIFNFSTLRNLSGLSNALVKQGSIIHLRCHSTQLSKTIYSGHINYFLKPHNLKMTTHSSPLQFNKIINNKIIQTRSKSTHGDHVNLWKLERIVAAAFVPLFPLCLMLDNFALDSLLAILSVIHVHWGLEAIIIDYARPIVVGPIVPKICFLSLYLMSALTLTGLLVLVYNGPGISKVIKQGWAIGKNE